MIFDNDESEYDNIGLYIFENEDCMSDSIMWKKISKNCRDIKSLECYLIDINWKSVSKNPNLTIEFIRKHQDKLNFNEIIKRCSLEILEAFSNHIDFKNASCNPNLTIDLVTKYENEIDWEILPQYCSLDILLKFENLLSEDIIDWFWFYASKNENLTIDLIRRHKNEVC